MHRRPLILLLIAIFCFSVLPAPAGPDGPADLVLLAPEERARLAASELPLAWTGASFLLARWDDDDQLIARTAGIEFRSLSLDSKRPGEIWLFELPPLKSPPENWARRTLHRTDRKWLLKAQPAEAKLWIEAGYSGHALNLQPRVPKPAGPESSRVAYGCAYDPAIDALLAQTSVPGWMDWIEKLSGAESLSIGGVDHVVETRHSSHMFAGSPTARAFDFAVAQLQDWSYPPADIELDPYSGVGGEWKNLVLTLPGQVHPEEVVMLTGHLDSVTSAGTSQAPGANDNGTGIATIFEAARLLRQMRFERTIRMVWFSGEEDGLLGSEAFVSDHPTAEILGVVNLDMFGYDGDGDRCFEIHAGTLVDSQDVGQCFADSVDQYGLGLSRDFLLAGATDRSDHASFWQAGVGAIEIAENFFNDGLPGGCVGSDGNPAYHTTSDTVSNVTPGYGFDIARAALATIAAMAVPTGTCFDQAPTVSLTPGVSSVEVSWTAVPGAASYRVYRSTESCDGQWVRVGETAGASWSDTTASEALSYSYRVEAVHADGICVSSPSVCAAATPTIYRAALSGWTPLDLCVTGGAGSGDGIVDPGETVRVPTTLVNDGNRDLTALSGVLSTTAPAVVVTDSQASWPDLAQGATAESLPDHFAIRLGEGLSCGPAIDAVVDLTYAQGVNPVPLTIPTGATVQSFLLEEDFTAGIPPSWTVVDGGSGGLAAATWTTANPGGRSIAAPFSSPFAIVDSDAAGSSASQDEQLIVPAFDASACSRVLVEFDNQFRAYSGGRAELCDVDVTTDGGTSWTNVLRLSGGSDGYSTPNFKSVDITDAISNDPSDVEIRFHYFDAMYEYWWAVDNVRVRCEQEICTPCLGAVAPPGEPTGLTLDLGGSQLLMQWSLAPAACGASDYAVYRGDLATLRGGSYDHDQVLTCQSGGSSWALAVDDPALGAADYFLVVGANGQSEGSYGRDGAGSERPGSIQCLPTQDLGICLP